MTGQLFISLLNPGLGVVLIAAFSLLWLNRKEQTYIAFAAASYVASTIGFLIQDVGPSLPMELHRLPANLCYLAAGYLMAMAVLGRYGVKIPHALLGAIAGAGAIGLSWFLLVQPNITYRIYSISFALGAVALVMAAKLRGIEKPRFMDRALFWLTVLTALNFIFRPAVIFALIGEIHDYNSPQQAFYWSTVQFTQMMISITYALSLLVAVATDLVAQLKQQAHTDQLSGLLNRRGFEEKAAEVLADHAGKRRPVALLIADLDHFKRINDTYGHGVGDTVISLFGTMLGRAAGPDMAVGRLGGEEFAIVMPGAEINIARLFAERIRAEIGLFEGQHRAIVQPEIGGEVAAHAGDGDAVGRDIGGDGEDETDPQQLVAAAQHAREVAGGPRQQSLEQVEAIADEGGHGRDHPAQHDADQRHHQHVAQRHEAQEPQEQGGAGHREGGADQHLAKDRHGRREQRRQQQAEACRFHRAGIGRLDEAVADHHLHDEAGHRHGRPRQDQRDRARNAARQQDL